ncbi:hypothetical protein [Methylobacterium sp. WSM2598]|uniref:hypothetical protein n=1 Tax=Methylobacterium sp. WSM2598 TaxID=398261 RepID=UPI000365F603|nr:hypothetical protein [Methylobacterium sp. WSM2598]
MASSSTLPSLAASDTRAVALNQVSWGAVIAGAVTALVAQIILNMVGLGIGLASLGPSAADNPAASTFSLGAGLWFVGSGIVASLAGGFIAGRLSGKPLAGAAGLHGLVSWAVTTLVVLYLLTSAAGSLVGGALTGVATTLGGAGTLVGGTVQTAAQAANPLEGIEEKVRQQANGQDPQALRDAAVAAMRAVLTGDPAQKQQAEARAADALAKAQGIPVEQARQQVQDYETQYAQAVATAKTKAQDAAVAAKSAATQGAFSAAIALILGAVAAFLGGLAGRVSPLAAAEAHRL